MAKKPKREPAKPDADPFWWIEGHREGLGWYRLYNFKRRDRARARGTLGLLLAPPEGTKVERDHLQYDDFRLIAPEDEPDD